MSSPTTMTAFPRERLWAALDPASLFDRDWALFRHGDLTRFLHQLVRDAAIPVQISQGGLSDEGCALHTLRFGTGPRRVLVWARQHGDEPDCQAALCASLDYLIRRGDDPWVAELLQAVEILVMPMVNPDGVVRFTRRNAQGLDLNREAVALSGPEAQALITLKHTFDPEYCFNLHDMNPRKSADDRDLVALAFQAGPFEQRDIDNEVRLKAKMICGIMAEEMRHYAPNNLARYTSDYLPKAFGDSMMRWGVSSILIEAGGWYEGKGGDNFVRRLFALSFLRGLHAVAAGEDAKPSGKLYETIPFDSGARFSDRQLAGGRVLNGAGRPPFRADVSFNIDNVVTAGCRETFPRSTVTDIGDLELALAKERIDIEGMAVLPGLMVASPAATFAGALPTDAEARPYLEAGITTLALGYGPFTQREARDAWLKEAGAAKPAINILAFERVANLDEIRQRHGLTPFAGFLVGGAQVLPEDLLELAHLFHPSHRPMMDPAHADSAVGIDLFFQMGRTPRQTRLYLQLSHENVDVRARKFLRTGDLIRFCKEFVDSPSQITFGIDPAEKEILWLPLLLSFGALSGGRIPEPDFFHRIIERDPSHDESRVVTALNLMHMRGLNPMVHAPTGVIAMESRVDLAVFPGELLTTGKSIRPELVFLNGRIAFSARAGIDSEAPRGALLLGAPHDV